MRMLICRKSSRPRPPTFRASVDMFLVLVLMAESAIMNRLQHAASGVKRFRTYLLRRL